MDKAHFVLAYAQRQRGQEILCFLGERLSGLVNDRAQRVVHVSRRSCEGVFVIAFDDDSPLRSVTRDNVDDFLRIGAVPHEVAEEGIAIRSGVSSVFQARLQRLEVAVDIGEEGDDQRSLRVP